MVVRRPRFSRDHVSIRGVSSINRVYEMKVMGVTFSDTLSLSPHVKYLYLSAKSAQTAFALRTLHVHGLSGRALWTVTQAHILSRLPYACSAWWDFCKSGERGQLAAVVIRLVKKKTICLQISQLSTKWWPLRTSEFSIKLSQAPPAYLLHSFHFRNYTHIICESAPMTSRSLHTKLTCQIQILSPEQY